MIMYIEKYNFTIIYFWLSFFVFVYFEQILYQTVTGLKKDLSGVQQVWWRYPQDCFPIMVALLGLYLFHDYELDCEICGCDIRSADGPLKNSRPHVTHL